MSRACNLLFCAGLRWDSIGTAGSLDLENAWIFACLPPPERGRSTREAGRVGVTPHARATPWSEAETLTQRFAPPRPLQGEGKERAASDGLHSRDRHHLEHLDRAAREAEVRVTLEHLGGGLMRLRLDDRIAGDVVACI
jgi:hypothetical protein